MTQRLQNLPALAADGIEKMLALEESLSKTSLEPALTLLVRIRASQINGCAWCMDMHTKELRAAGESEQRLYLLSAVPGNYQSAVHRAAE